MKKNLVVVLALVIVAAALAAFGQNGNQTATPQPQGGPQAWCDQNGDSLCDVTGLPVGQGCGRMAGGAFCARGTGTGQRLGMGYGRGAGMGYGRAAGRNCPRLNIPAASQGAAQPGK